MYAGMLATSQRPTIAAIRLYQLLPTHPLSLMKRDRKRRRRLENIEPYSHDDVYWHEICDLLGKDTVQRAIEQETDLDSPFKVGEEVELEVQRISSNGELNSTEMLLKHAKLLYDQAKALQQQYRPNSLGCVLCPSPYQERRSAPEYTGMQDCTLSLTFLMWNEKTRICEIFPG